MGGVSDDSIARKFSKCIIANSQDFVNYGIDLRNDVYGRVNLKERVSCKRGPVTVQVDSRPRGPHNMHGTQPTARACACKALCYLLRPPNNYTLFRLSSSYKAWNRPAPITPTRS